ncbi:ferrochelatase [Aliifodinibius sp. S!AR15-10]|uniref:ferrochelatase n=1 Tax=Aliifodinibius sp. S!AR15-10 TaxID=2950437 RepID=UPI0028605DB5|nr:ferrochelatase [Aliifodinibius sp. S!AR15-10]MDR8392474.1 ferrochelatase [Aliifodinibius sp. S!AR15-10]
MPDQKIKLGVVLMNLGGPTGEDYVRPFLYNLFRDEDIIKMGGGKLQDVFANVIAKFRAPSVAEDYEEINGCPKGCTGNKHCPNRKNSVVSTCCSPINGLTEQQRRSLEKHLKKVLPGNVEANVYTCMRYFVPFAETTMQDMVDDGITHAVMVPLYPQFSWTTTGSSFRDWETKRKKKFGDDTPWKEFHVKNYYLNPDYLEAMNARIDEELDAMDEETRNKTHLIFSAHGTPLLEVKSGDPYTAEIKETMEAIMEMRNYKEPYWLGYQSKVGPQKWTQPNTAELVERHLEYGIKNFLMVPIAFVTDHIETLYELGIELKEDLEEEGYEFENLAVMKGLNDHPSYIKALSDEVINKIDHLLPEQQSKTDFKDKVTA